MANSDLPPVIFLMGPTASGKTELSVNLALKLDTEIISVDSALIYRGMDIGTAKPSLDERRGVPHHLIDILEPTQSYSTAAFRRSALELIERIGSQGKVPILTGGTMLYFNALVNGLAVLPEADQTLREALEKQFVEHGKLAMHDQLKSIDPQAAQRIHPNDPQRVQRALEVFELTGKSLTENLQMQEAAVLPFRVIKLIVAPSDRKKLHDKIAKRFKTMLLEGLVDEVKTLYERGDLTEAMPAVRAVGYRQVWSYLKGEYDFNSMVEKGIIATRQLAKRQFTWLRKEKQAYQLESYKPELSKEVYDLIQHRL